MKYMEICAFKSFSSGFSMSSGSIQSGDQTASSRMPRLSLQLKHNDKVFLKSYNFRHWVFKHKRSQIIIYGCTKTRYYWFVKHFEVKFILWLTKQIILRKCPDYCRSANSRISLTLDSTLYGEAECQAFMWNGLYRLPAWYTSNSQRWTSVMN